jgi:hypothetical protein
MMGQNLVISWRVPVNNTSFYVFLDQKRDFFLGFSENYNKIKN